MEGRSVLPRGLSLLASRGTGRRPSALHPQVRAPGARVTGIISALPPLASSLKPARVPAPGLPPRAQPDGEAAGNRRPAPRPPARKRGAPPRAARSQRHRADGASGRAASAPCHRRPPLVVHPVRSCPGLWRHVSLTPARWSSHPASGPAPLLQDRGVTQLTNRSSRAHGPWVILQGIGRLLIYQVLDRILETDTVPRRLHVRSLGDTLHA